MLGSAALVLSAAFPGTGWSQALTILHHERPPELVAAGGGVPSSRGGLPADASAKPSPLAHELTFVAFGRRFDVLLSPNDRVRSRLGRNLSSAALETELLRGELRNLPGSWVRLTRTRGRLSGLIWDGQELYAIEPFGDIEPSLVTPDTAAADDPVVYRLRDVHGEFADLLRPMWPGIHAAPGGATSAAGGGATSAAGGDSSTAGGPSSSESGVPAEARFPAFAPAAQKSALSPLRQVDIALIADEGFETSHPEPEALLLAIANNVDGIYSTQLGLHLNVTEIEFVPDDSTPLTATDPSSLLTQVAAYKGSQPHLQARGLAHFFTRRALHDDNDSVGIAYLSSICHATAGVGLTRAHAGITTTSLIAAHEIGHNLGAGHDGDVPCTSTPSTQFLMAPRINGSSVLSQCSIEQMVAELATAPCLSNVSWSADLAVQMTSDLPSPVFVGQSFDLRFRITNEGIEDSRSFDFEIDGGALTLDGMRFATTPSGPIDLFCHNDPPSGAVPGCRLSRLEAGGAVELIASVRVHQVGPLELVASTRSEGDPEPANDAVRIALEALPSLRVGYATSFPEQSVHRPGDRVTRVIEIVNHGNLTADDVDLLFNISPQLELESLVDATGTPCPAIGYAAGSYRCAAPVLTPGASALFTLTVTIAHNSWLAVGSVYEHTVGLSIETALPNLDPNPYRTLRLRATPVIADLEVDLVLPATLEPWTPIEVRFSARNAGPDAVENVAVQFVSRLMPVTSVDAGAGHCEMTGTPEALLCTIARLEPSQSFDVVVQTTTQAGSEDVLVSIEGVNRHDPNYENDRLWRHVSFISPRPTTSTRTPSQSGRGGSGGSGAHGQATLIGLALLALFARRRRLNA